MKAKRFSLAALGLVISLILLVGGGILSPVPASAAGTVTISLDPATCTVAAGGTFTVDIKVSITDSERVDTVQALLNFDPTKLQVQSITRGAAISAWDTFASANKWDNTNGTISYFAYTFNDALKMNQTFVFATIKFKASEVPGNTPITFVTEAKIKTNLWYNGASVLDGVEDGAVEISEAVISQIAFTTPARTVTAGQVSDVMTIETRNAEGVAVSVTENTTITLNTTALLTGRFYSTATSTTPITSVTINSGTSSASFYYKDTAAGTPTITADESPTQGWTAASQPVTVVAGPTPVISQIAFINPARTLQAGEVGNMTIQTQDSSGSAVNVTSNTTISLSSNSTGGSFYSDAVGNTTITSVTIISGTSSASFYYKDTKVGTPTITATASGQVWTPGTQTETVIAGVISQIVFTTPARIGALSLTAGVVSAVMTIQTQNAYDSPTNVTSATTINLTSSATTGRFYSSANSTTPITAVTISSGANSVSFYYNDTKAGSLSITVTESPILGWTAASQIENVKAAAAAKLVVFGITDPVEAGTACTVTVTAVDAYGNTDTTYAGTINFTSSDAKATLPAAYTFVAGTGSHDFAGGVTLNTVGDNQWVKVTGILNNNTITGEQTGITVTGAAAAKGTNWGAIIGGIIGGLVLIGIIVYLLGRKKRV